MAKVVGIGGVFFKSDDPAALGKWYEKWLGMQIEPSYGGSHFFHAKSPPGAYTVWGPFKSDTDYFDPSPNDFMFNLIVDDLDEALKQVEEGGASIHGQSIEEGLGAFGWFVDPDGNKVELWQPE